MIQDHPSSLGSGRSMVGHLQASSSPPLNTCMVLTCCSQPLARIQSSGAAQLGYRSPEHTRNCSALAPTPITSSTACPPPPGTGVMSCHKGPRCLPQWPHLSSRRQESAQMPPDRTSNTLTLTSSLCCWVWLCSGFSPNRRVSASFSTAWFSLLRSRAWGRGEAGWQAGDEGQTCVHPCSGCLCSLQHLLLGDNRPSQPLPSSQAPPARSLPPQLFRGIWSKVKMETNTGTATQTSRLMQNLWPQKHSPSALQASHG